MKYPFVPVPERNKLVWPNEARLAVILTTNLEYWDPVIEGAAPDKPFYAGGAGIVPHELPGHVYDNVNWTWREYGQRVGVWRMFDLFEAEGVPTSCTMNAKMALERPQVIQAAVKRGYEIVAHNYVQTDLLTNYQFDLEGERGLIRRTLDVYRETLGRPARGWLSCALRCNQTTVDILAEEGLSFICDYMNDDQPYLMRTERGSPFVSIPYTAETNDFSIFMRQGKDVDVAVRIFKDQFDQLYEEGAQSGRMMNIGLHPHIIGQPYRIRALREFIAYAKTFPGVWWPKREEIADWYLENCLDHIPGQ